MYHKNRIFLFVFFSLFLFCSGTVSAQKQKSKTECKVENTICVLGALEATADTIDNKDWRDQTYRELAKSYTKEKEIDKAIALIAKILTPDTKAMTIRGIGMETAQLSLTPEKNKEIFQSLRAQAEKIEHPSSYAIALTYIAMAQAFAGDNEGAWKTASEMKNDALRHKAYGETAEIQAELGDFKAAVISINKIDSIVFRNKAYHSISNILSDQGLYNEGYKAARAITNAYKQAQAMQYLYNKIKINKKKGGPL